MQGKDYEFIVKANSVVSGNFTAYSTEQEPWLKFDHSANFDSQGGVVSVSMAFAPQGGNYGERLLTVKISDVNFKETEAQHHDATGWFASGDRSTKLMWSITRQVEVLEGEYGKSLALLDVDYEGVAEALKVQNSGEVQWGKKARTLSTDVRLTIDGKSCSFENHWTDEPPNMSWGWNMVRDIPWEQEYKVTGGADFDFHYKDQWGVDEVFVHAGADSNPVVAAALGFMIAYWLHPTRVQDDAAELAMKILQSRLGFFSWS